MCGWRIRSFEDFEDLEVFEDIELALELEDLSDEGIELKDSLKYGDSNCSKSSSPLLNFDEYNSTTNGCYTKNFQSLTNICKLQTHPQCYNTS